MFTVSLPRVSACVRGNFLLTSNYYIKQLRHTDIFLYLLQLRINMSDVGQDDYSNLFNRNAIVTESTPAKDDPLTKWQIDNAEQNERLEHYLKGDIIKWSDEVRNLVYVNDGKRLMNDEGVRMTMTIVSSLTDKTVVLSTLTAKEISNAMKRLHKQIVLHYAENWKEYGIRKTDLTPIVAVITTRIWMSFKRAEGGSEKNFLAKLGQARREVSVLNSQEQNKSKGWMPNFLGGK